jgi:energy-coupling factor transport system substrate-specific component
MSAKWRTVDIVVTAAIGVAFGVVFWAWGLVWTATEPVFVALPPAQNVLYGLWFTAAIVAALVTRKPGAALFAELVAASVEALFGGQWGLDTLVSGAIQGFAVEIAFAIFRYQRWDITATLLAAVFAAIGAWIHDMPVFYKELALPDQLVIGVFMIIGAVIIAGFGSWWLTRALVQSGVLAQFASGRAQSRV